MNEERFNKALNSMFGDNDEKFRYTFYSEKEEYPIRIEGYIKQFVFEQKLGGKIKWKIYHEDNHYLIDIFSSEGTFKDFKIWLSKDNVNYDFLKRNV